MRTIVIIATFAAAAILSGCSCSGQEEPEPATVYTSVDTVPLLVMQIQQCSRLYTTEYKVHKIVTHDDVVNLRGSLFKQDINVKLPLGDRKVAIPMDATLKAYIDFSGFSAANIERDGQKITIVLPDPKVVLTSSKVNQHEIRSYVGLVRAGRARADAARVLVPLLSQLGFRDTDITIAYRKDFKPYDIRRYLEVKGEGASPVKSEE